MSIELDFVKQLTTSKAVKEEADLISKRQIKESFNTLINSPFLFGKSRADVEQLEDKVKIKLNPISEVVKGKRVIMIDDSIVRGTTSARIVRLVREAGAKEVHVRISAPPFVAPCYYGVDIDSKENLIACKNTIPEIAEIIGADSLGYLSREDVTKLADGSNCTGFCCACFDEKYPTPIPQGSKNKFEQKIDKTKKKNKGKGDTNEELQ